MTQSEPIGLSFDGSDPEPPAQEGVELGPDADLVGADVDDADRGDFPEAARFDDEQWAVLQHVRAEIAAAEQA